MSEPFTIETDRLILRRPQVEDATAIFERYASDTEVTQYVGWPRHRDIEETRTFLEFSNAEWGRWPAGPYLIFSKTDHLLLGSTGLGFETSHRASTGYVLAKDAWGHGYATEALQAMVKLAGQSGIVRLYALCHPDHRASGRVLEKCGFDLEATLRCHTEFFNLTPGSPVDTLCYVLIQSPLSIS